MKRKRNLGKLLVRTHRREQLQLHPHDIEVLAHFDCIRDAHEAGCALNEDDIQFLITLGEAYTYTLPAREGRLAGYRDDRQRDLRCAKHLFEVGKQAYGGKRLRDQHVELKLRTRAVRLLKYYRPQTSIERDDLRRFRTKTSTEVIAYVDEHMPRAKAGMQQYARSLAREGARSRTNVARRRTVP